MQIMPSGGGWTNAAASAQQGHNDLKNSSPLQRASVTDNAIKVDRSEKSGDRDANERYDGPQAENDHGANRSNSAEGTSENTGDLLSLPATEDTAPSTLDLLG